MRHKYKHEVLDFRLLLKCKNGRLNNNNNNILLWKKETAHGFYLSLFPIGLSLPRQ